MAKIFALILWLPCDGARPGPVAIMGTRESHWRSVVKGSRLSPRNRPSGATPEPPASTVRLPGQRTAMMVAAWATASLAPGGAAPARSSVRRTAAATRSPAADRRRRRRRHRTRATRLVRPRAAAARPPSPRTPDRRESDSARRQSREHLVQHALALTRYTSPNTLRQSVRARSDRSSASRPETCTGPPK